MPQRMTLRERWFTLMIKQKLEHLLIEDKKSDEKIWDPQV